MAAWLRTISVASLLVVLLVGRADAAGPGDLDPSFGGGRVIVPFGSEAGGRGVAAQPDGKSLYAGSFKGSQEFAIARLLSNGSPDPGFGGTGVVATPLGEFARSTDVAVQGDGRIVAVGEANQDFAIVRYRENGELDPSFGEGGVVILPVGTSSDSANAVAIGPGGLIAVTGTSEIPPFDRGAGVAMLRSNGDPETGFAEDGTTVITSDEGDDRGEGIAFDSDGRVVIADASGSGGGHGFTVVRLGTDGKPDPSFGGDGIVQTPLQGEGGDNDGRSTDVAIQADGKIVAAGYGFDEFGVPPEDVSTFALARYGTDGELDPSFGSGGVVNERLGEGGDLGWGIAIAADGRLVLAGTYDTDPSPVDERVAPAVLRFQPDGSLDPTFGSGGSVRSPLPSGVEEEFVEAIAIQPDGRILTTGEASPAVLPSSAVATRYLADFEKPIAGPPRLGQPDTNMKSVPRRLSLGALKAVRGTASDPGGEGLREVQVAFVRVFPAAASASRHAKAGCASMSRSGRFGRRRVGHPGKGCAQRWLTARGTAKWSFKLPRALPEGRYVVFCRAVDVQGIAENSFSRRDRNRYAFRVSGG
jgi:uncharacterized delta-60 repeat protein